MWNLFLVPKVSCSKNSSFASIVSYISPIYLLEYFFLPIFWSISTIFTFPSFSSTLYSLSALNPSFALMQFISALYLTLQRVISSGLSQKSTYNSLWILSENITSLVSFI